MLQFHPTAKPGATAPPGVRDYRTNERLDSIGTAFRGVSGTVIAICGSGDQGLVILDHLNPQTDELLLVDRNGYQLDYAQQRFEGIARGDFERHREQGIPARKTHQSNVAVNNAYLTDERLDRISKRLSIVRFAKADIFDVDSAIHGLAHTALYLSNAPDCFNGSSQQAVEVLRSLAAHQSEGTLVYQVVDPLKSYQRNDGVVVAGLQRVAYWVQQAGVWQPDQQQTRLIKLIEQQGFEQWEPLLARKAA